LYRITRPLTTMKSIHNPSDRPPNSEWYGGPGSSRINRGSTLTASMERRAGDLLGD
jgi:hypothetical protein